MNYKLFLDDYRNPSDATINIEGAWGGNRISLQKISGIADSEWSVVKSYDEFVEFVNTKGIPQVVSFDSDLEEKHYSGDYSDGKTGLDCLLWLIEKCKEKGCKFPEKCYIHSYNAEKRKEMNQIINKIYDT